MLNQDVVRVVDQQALGRPDGDGQPVGVLIPALPGGWVIAAVDADAGRQADAAVGAEGDKHVTGRSRRRNPGLDLTLRLGLRARFVSLPSGDTKIASAIVPSIPSQFESTKVRSGMSGAPGWIAALVGAQSY